MGGKPNPPVVLKDPYRLNFAHADVPSKPDHSMQSPGPPRDDGKRRAGYTKAILQKKVTAAWDGSPARADGRIAVFATTVDIDFLLDPIAVAVSSDYSEGSCPYRVTLRHEVEDHAKSYIKIFLSYRDTLVNRLNSIPFPTKSAPNWMKPNDVAAFQDGLGEKLKETILDVAGKLKAEMTADRNAKDSPDAYNVIYRQCSPDEW